MATTAVPHANLKDVVRASYDKIAAEYQDWTLSRSSPRLKYLEHLLGTLSSGAKVLELGCGSGYPVTLKLCETAATDTVIANDISEQQIKLARERCQQWVSKVVFIAGDMMALDFRERELDGVVAFFSIFHLPKDEQTEMFKRVQSWLKPGGIFVCNFGSKDTGAEATARRWDQFGADMFWGGFDVDIYKKVIAEAGFEILAADVRNASEDIDPNELVSSTDPDRDVEFLWIVASKR